LLTKDPKQRLIEVGNISNHPFFAEMKLDGPCNLVKKLDLFCKKSSDYCEDFESIDSMYDYFKIE